MVSKSQKSAGTAKADAAAESARIEEQIARVRSELAALGGIVADYGSSRLRGAELEAVEELQRQLSTLEAGVKRKMREQPFQVLGLAALAGLVFGLMLRR
ncbi:hypothetical protein [Pararhodobacter sp. SW119]|uniref:hypothetical protein n=1 Tax=Pararhodobacter sp. SW119 TaxID=2780075 RepID=UPI001ADFABB6|nr:hypothetical protein [Pararhodobacter sp. SW119]